MNAPYDAPMDLRQEPAGGEFEIFRCRDDASCNMSPHDHDFYELTCPLSDGMDYIVEGTRYALGKGSLLLVAPGRLHRPDLSRAREDDPAAPVPERIVLRLNAGFVDSLTEALPRVGRTLAGGMPGRGPITPDAETYELLQGLLFSLLREKQLAEADSPALSRLVVIQLLIQLSRCLSRSPEPESNEGGKRKAGVMRIYEYIGAHLADSLSVAGLAEQFFMDKNTLTRQFKRLVGMTPGECIRRRRLEAAHAMIRNGAGMQEACEACGFSDYSAFYRAFRQVYAMSPSAFAARSRAARAKNPPER